MKIGKLPLIAGAAVLFFALKKANAAKNLSFFFRGMSFKNFPECEILVGIQNPSGESFKLDSLIGDVTVNGNMVGSIESFQKVVIMANNETVMKIKLKPSLVALGETLGQMFLRKKKNAFNVNLTGTANVAGFPIPLNVNYVM